LAGILSPAGEAADAVRRIRNSRHEAASGVTERALAQHLALAYLGEVH
jgi:hypothetical protein